MGPFDSAPFNLHISPFLNREKVRLNTSKTIMDLSWPKKISVNNGVASNE